MGLLGVLKIVKNVKNSTLILPMFGSKQRDQESNYCIETHCFNFQQSRCRLIVESLSHDDFRHLILDRLKLL